MAHLAPYLTFDGNCREAMTFYGQAFGVDPFIQSFGDSPVDAPADAQERVMHARIDAGSVQLMASDSQPGEGVVAGDNVSLSVHSDSADEQARLFNALAEGGTITMPLQDTFWNARFGMLTDRFGMHWMFNHELAAG